MATKTESAHNADFEDARLKSHQLLSKEELVELSRIKHGQVIRDVILIWLQILLAIEIAILSQSVVVVILAVIYIGCMQNGLISWTHEASHYNLTRSKRLNDLLADLFIAGPAGVAVNAYRWHHVLHHRYLGDPTKEIALEMWLCLRGGYLYSEIARYLLGAYVIRMILRYFGKGMEHLTQVKEQPKRTPASLVSFAIGNTLLLLMCALQGQWYLYFVLWVFPLFTIALLTSNFRTVVEHQPSSDVCDTGLVKLAPITRVIRSHPIERYLIAPVGFYFHYEHHLFPGIPYHRLKETRALLTQKGHFNSPDIVWGEGYIKTIWNLAMTPGYGIRLLNPLHDFEHNPPNPAGNG